VNDWKTIIKIVLGCAVLIMVMVFGLARMSGTNTALTVEEKKLLTGAKLIKENGEIKVTVVNFSDMECPACQRAHELTNSLSDMPGVRVVFRHFPLSIHKYSSITASAVEAARLMGKGWEMIDLLYSKQDEWSGTANINGKLMEYAASLGLDTKIFDGYLNSASVSATVREDIALGDNLELPGTPTIFVNGEQVGADFVVSKVNELIK